MKFYLYFLSLLFSGFLISCSGSKQLFSSSSGSYEFTNSGSSAYTSPANEVVTNQTSGHDEPVLALANVSSDKSIHPSQFYSSYSKAVPKLSAPDIATSSFTSSELSAPTETAGITDKNPIPGGNRIYKLGMMSLAAGILAFVPFLTGLSLLFSVPFVIAGLLLARAALKGKKGNYRQRGIALAKAGLLMSGVIGVILILLGAMALLG